MNRQYQINTSTSSKSVWNNIYMPNKSQVSSMKAVKRSGRELSPIERHYTEPSLSISHQSRFSPSIVQQKSENIQPSLVNEEQQGDKNKAGVKLKLQNLVAGMREREQFLDDLGELKCKNNGEGQIGNEQNKECFEFNSYPIPEEIMQNYKGLDPDSYVHKGLFPLLNTCYFILHDCLLLWKINNDANLYDNLSIQTDNICKMQFERQIQAIQLYRNYDKFYQHSFMLIISFDNRFSIYNINDQFEYILVQDNILKNNIITNCIEVSNDNRIFFGGNTDCLYEIECKNRKYKVKNYKQALDKDLIINNIKKKLKEYNQLLKGKEIIQISIDNSRNLVYALCKSTNNMSNIQVYDTEESLTYLFQMSDIQIKEEINRYQQLREIVCIDYIIPVEEQESKTVSVVAVTSGLRVFLELGRRKDLIVDKHCDNIKGLRVAFVKPIGSENSGHCVYYQKWGRRSVMIQKGEQEQLYCQMSTHMRGETEHVQKIGVALEDEDIVMSQIEEINGNQQLVTLLQSSGIAYSQTMAEQQFNQPFHLMLLTHRMLHLVIQLRPLDLLFTSLINQDHLSLHQMVTLYGLPVLCTMLLHIVINQETLYYMIDETGNVSTTKAQQSIKQSANDLFHFFSQQSHASYSDKQSMMNNPLLTMKQDEYGRALETVTTSMSVYLESILTYYSRITGLVRHKTLIDAGVYNYQKQSMLSQLTNSQLTYLVIRLNELNDLLAIPRPTLPPKAHLSSMVSALTPLYPLQAQQPDLLEENKLLTELRLQLATQLEWLQAMQMLNCPQLRLLIEQMNPVQIQMLLHQQYKHLFRQPATHNYVIKNLIMYYLMDTPHLFQDKRQQCESSFKLVITNQEIEAAYSILQLKQVVQQQMECQRQQAKTLHKHKHKHKHRQEDEQEDEQEVSMIQQRVLGMDNQSGVAIVTGAMETLREYCTVLDQYLLNDIFEQLDFLGGYVQFNQLVLAKLNTLEPQSVLFQSLSEIVVGLVQDDKHQVLHGLSREQTMVIHQQVLQDVIRFDNQYLNREIITYLFSRQLYHEFVLFPVKDVDSFLQHNIGILDTQSGDNIDRNKFIYKYYVQSEQYQAAYDLMIRLSHTESLQLQLRLFAFNCAQSALTSHAPDHRQLSVIAEQLKHLLVQDRLGMFVQQNHSSHVSFQSLIYTIMGIQEMYDLAHSLNYYEGQLIVYDLNNHIQEDVVRELYNKLFSQILTQHGNDENRFVIECQQVLKRLNSCINSRKMLDCAILVQEMQSINHMHPGFVKYIKQLNQPHKNICSPFWLFPFIQQNLSNVNTSNILNIYIDMFTSVQQKIFQANGQAIYQVIEIMFPINSLQAMLETEIATVDQQLSANLKQKALASFILQNSKISAIIDKLDETLKQLQEQCLIDDDLIVFSLNLNKKIKESHKILQEKIRIVCKK